ncbi:putative enoyl-CoA hydratase/isomerase family protein [Trichoderma citrinoviride]|uniref:Putative enoyl-CoA hydratase/isomerase family protein n=1 Tax=Trichoderma citrinoviride TaxID=58853 RepID=A0A2T4BBP6_9HYPO|nr:putative enoyl-CoA hydratase/isomerase family protein [Trichoderma citrinoviride]PTB66756.1 putative enoyl-CoA hydratase/isomerase family protein [Trichoderma citrinoviride]
MIKSIAVPAPPFDLTLSHWDRIFPPTHSKRILCFALPDNADKEQIIDQLHIALHYTVQQIPFLAGSLVPRVEDEGKRPWLRTISSAGAAYLDVVELSDQLSFSFFAESNFDQQLFDADQLCSLPQVAYVQEEPVNVCRFQATFIEGGLLLAIQILHTVVDGRGVTDCIRIFADNFRRAQSGAIGHPLETATSVYSLDRSALLSADGAVGDEEKHPAFTTSPLVSGKFIGVENGCHTFHMSAKALEALKKAATPQPGAEDATWISTGDAIAALIWRSVMLARLRAGLLPADATVVMTQPLDVRAMLGLPEPYFGNAFYITRPSLPLSALADPEDGLRTAAKALRTDIKSMTGDKFRDFLGLAERSALAEPIRLSTMGDAATTAITYSSHFAFNVHELDFGPAFGDGRVKAFRHPARGTMPGAVIVMPKLQDGGLIQLNRPSAKNAISVQLLQELAAQIEGIHSEDRTSPHQTRALVLASALNDVFCAGADLRERRNMTTAETQVFLASLRNTFFRLSSLSIPSIACVSGLALGGGLELALCCNFRVFSSLAVVGLPETRLAIIPGAGGTYRLPKLIGQMHAMDLILTGRRVPAAEAAEMGMCNRLVTVEETSSLEDARNMTLEAGILLAREITYGGPVAVRAALTALAGMSEEAENAAYETVLETQDRLEALRAFGNGHEPVFVGN